MPDQGLQPFGRHLDLLHDGGAGRDLVVERRVQLGEGALANGRAG
ncbi:hypothetical protein [Streptomyces arboris]|nr:hypothetical protein [Streptomyces arboris]